MSDVKELTRKTQRKCERGKEGMGLVRKEKGEG